MTAPTRTTITTPQNNSTNTLAVNMPGSVVASDLLICVLSHGGTNVNMPGTNPWHKKIENSNSICVAYLRGSEHIANSSPATYSFTTGGASAITNAYVIRLTGAALTGDPFDQLVTGATTANTSSAALSFTTTVVDVYLHSGDFKSATRTLSTAPTGMTQIAGGAGNSFQHAFESTQGATGGTGTKTSVYTVGSSHSTVLFAIKPQVIKTGSASGAWTFAGAADSDTKHKGHSAGFFSFAGASAGQIGVEGHAAGSFNFAGLADGDTKHKGNASGTWTNILGGSGHTSYHGSSAGTHSWTGTASGIETPQPPHGDAHGFFNYDLDGTGLGQYHGSINKAWNFTGSAQGQISGGGHSNGAWSFAGTADGDISVEGHSNGFFTFTGIANGEKAPVGHVNGFFTWAGTTEGDTKHKGQSTGFFTFAGTASGNLGNNGSADGAWSFGGSAQGTKKPHGGFFGNSRFTGAARGKGQYWGHAHGFHTWQGFAVGPVKSATRNPEAAIVEKRWYAEVIEPEDTATVPQSAKAAIL